MSNAKEFEQARLSPALRHSGKAVSNTRFLKQDRRMSLQHRSLLCGAQQGQPRLVVLCQGWRAGCAPSPAAHEPLPLAWLEILACLDSFNFSPTFDEIPIWDVASVSHRLL